MRYLFKLKILFLTLFIAIVPSCKCDLGFDSSTSESSPGGPIAVLFHLDGGMPQFSDASFLFGAPALSQQTFEKRMKKAKDDILVQEVIVHFGSLKIGFARANELSQIIKEVAKKKPVTCQLESADNRIYWLAAKSCPKILLAPAGGIEVIGLAVEGVFLKELLDKMGIHADMLSVGKYKSAAENVTRNDMSQAARDATESLLKDINKRFINDISKSRKLSYEQVESLINEGPFTAAQAKKLKLVDDIQSIATLQSKLSNKYKGGVKENYGKKPPKEMDFSDLVKMFSGEKSKTESNGKPKIAIIPAEGPIQSGKKVDNMLSGSEGVFDLELIKNLFKAGKDDSVKAIVLRIDSPGGSALASDNIWEAIKIVSKQKPVVASMGDVAASGGYYIASATDYIYADANTITGSIGVVGGKMVLGEGLKKIGIHNDTISLAQNATILSPFTPFSDSEREVILKSMQSIYDLFLSRVSKGRNIKKESVKKVAEGRVWTGAQALKYKLIDKTGSINDAIKKAKMLANAQAAKASLYPPPKTFIEVLGEQLSGSDDVKLELARQFKSTQRALELGDLLLKEKTLTFCPYSFDIR